MYQVNDKNFNIRSNIWIYLHKVYGIIFMIVDYIFSPIHAGLFAVETVCFSFIKRDVEFM